MKKIDLNKDKVLLPADGKKGSFSRFHIHCIERKINRRKNSLYYICEGLFVEDDIDKLQYDYDPWDEIDM